ncbi:MAG: histidine kinase, partial [Dehalococcoidia bacterium]
MTISRIKWIAIVAPILFLLMIEEVDRFLLHPHFGHSTGYLFKMSALIAGAVVFSALIFRAIERVQQSLVQRNRELLALDEIGRTVTGSNHLHQELTVALDQVIRVTSSIAGRVFVEGYGESDPPTYVSLGDPEAFAGLPEDDRILSGVNSARTVQISVIHEPLALATRGTLNEHTAALVPLVALDRTIGSLRLVAAGARLAMESERLLTAIGHQLGVAVQASHLFRDVERRREESQALYELGLRIASLEDPERVLDIVVDQARRLLAVDRAGLCMAESSPDNEDSSFHDWESKHVTRSGAHVEECSALAPEYRRFSLTSPLRLGGRTVGQLSVGNRSPRLFSPRDRIFLDSIADMAAIALSNARLLRSERQVAVLEERERISRELHDSSSQALGYLHLKCLAVARTAANGQLEPVEAELRDMASVAKDAYADVREAILGLREASPAGGTFVET